MKNKPISSVHNIYDVKCNFEKVVKNVRFLMKVYILCNVESKTIANQVSFAKIEMID